MIIKVVRKDFILFSKYLNATIHKITRIKWVFLLSICAVLVVAIVFVSKRRKSEYHSVNQYGPARFYPRVRYRGAEVLILNPESGPYLETKVTLFVGWTTCQTLIGTIRPVEEAVVPLHNFVFEDGRRFDAATMKAKLLEVRALMEGYEVHRDLPPP